MINPPEPLLEKAFPVGGAVFDKPVVSCKNGLFNWLSGLKRAPRHLFVTHGESSAAQRFGEFLRDKTGWEISVPEYGAEAFLE